MSNWQKIFYQCKLIVWKKKNCFFAMFKKLIPSLLALCLLNSCMIGAAGLAAMSVSGAKRSNLSETMSDLKISSVIKAKFIEEGFSDLYSKISIQVLFGKVFLIGHVSSEKDLNKAIEIVANTKDVTDIVNELDVTKDSDYFNTKQYLTDTYITSAVKSRLLSAKDLRSLKFTVITQDNIVYLFGVVDSHEKLEEANSVASYTKGVAKVKSYVIVKEKTQ